MDINRSGSEWNHGGFGFDFDCMVPDSDPVLARNQLDDSDFKKKTNILKVLELVPIIVSVTVPNPK